MSKRKGVLPPVQTSSLVMRAIDTSAPTRAVIATENPVRRFDEESQQVVNEVLLMEGIELRAGRDQVPIVDSHDDSTARNILGSIQRLQVDHANGELYGVPVFANDADAQTIKARMDEGHITDFSITAQPLESMFVPRGQSYTTARGAVIEGPAVIHKRWQPHNASICATGADEYSTVRRSYTDLFRKVKRMDEALLSQLSSMGLPDGMTDPNQVLAWVVGKLKPEEAAAPVESAAEEVPAEEMPLPPVEKMEGMEEEKPVVANSLARSAAEAAKLIKRALDADKARRKEIEATCNLAKVERAFADQLCDAGVSVEVAKQRIIERMATQPLGSSVGADVRVTESGDDKFRNAVRDGLVVRSAKGTGRKPVATLAEGYNDFTERPLDDIARELLRRSGAAVDRLSRREVVQIAMGNQRIARKHNIVMRSDAYHSTGTFSNILLDVVNKSLLDGYEEAPYSWSMWARQAPSVADLKTIYRTRISEFPNLEMVAEGAKYPEKVMSDSKESYSVQKYGAEFSITWEAVVNDDLDAFSRVPAVMGNSARRTQNAKVYEVLTANALMGDGNALFSSSHTSGDNTSGAAAAPSVTTLNAAFLKMRKQIGLTTGAILNIQPRFLIVPAAYEATAMEVLGSMARPEVGGSAAGNSNTHNIYGPGGKRSNLTIVADAILDAASATNWYLAADPAQVDTVELTFLQGEESPVTDTEEDFDTDTYKYKIRQTFGVKAIDWRGLFRNSA